MTAKSRLTLLAATAVASLMAGVALAEDPVPQNDLLNATLWVSNSVEFRANTLSMFQLAKMRLDEAIADKNWSATGQTNVGDKPLAIVTDADETMIDNGGYEGWLIVAKQDFGSKTYDAWTKAMAAKAVPGAVEFAKYADSKGVKVFYVTNRDATQEEATRKNMEALGFPMGGNVDTFLMSKEKPEWTSKKGTRRDFVGKDYRVLLLLGDNYGDFSDDYDKSEADRMKSLEANMAHVGKDWIFIANPEYGSFESAPFANDYKKSADQRRAEKIKSLPAWAGPPQ